MVYPSKFQGKVMCVIAMVAGLLFGPALFWWAMLSAKTVSDAGRAVTCQLT